MADQDDAEACSMNIGPNERKKRMMSGYIGIGAGLLAAGALFFFKVPELFRLALFVPFWFGGLGVFQARAKT